MKKIIRVLILSVTVLGFAQYKILPIQASEITISDVSNLRLLHQRTTTNPVAAENEEWNIECIDCPSEFSDMTDRSLQLDTAGRPHIAYGGKHLYYSWYDGSKWTREIVDASAAVGRFASIALDGNDRPYISYFDEKNNAFKCANLTSTGWEIEIVATLSPELWQYDGLDIALALDNMGNPHISYINLVDDHDEIEDFDQLVYVYKDAGSWHTEVIDHAGTGKISMDLDEYAYAHIAYIDPQFGDLMYAYQDSQGWHTQSVDGLWTYQYPSLALDKLGFPHIAYYDTYQRDLRYIYQDQGGWHIVLVDREDQVGEHISLAVDANNFAHISYNELIGESTYERELKYAFQDPSGWLIQTVDSGMEAGHFTSIILTSHSEALISYQSGGELYLSDLKLASNSDGGWQIETVDREREIGNKTNLILDDANVPHTSFNEYYKYVDIGDEYGNLFFGIRYQTDWYLEQVDTQGGDSSIAFDRQGNKHITYTSQGKLIYATQNEAAWKSQVVDMIGWLNSGSSLAVDDQGVPHIAYFNSDDHTIRYAYLGTTGWYTQTVDSGFELWFGPSLVLGSQGEPHISYYNNIELKYAVRDTIGWQIQVVDSEGDVGAFSSLKLDNSGYAHISYNGDNGELKYAYQDKSGWHIQTVSDQGGYSSLDLDRNGYPHISFVSEGNLIYTIHEPSGWYSQTVDIGSKEWLWFGSSIALDSDDYPYIIYSIDGDLKYAYQAPPAYYLSLTPVEINGYSLPGSSITYSLHVNNLGQQSDSYSITTSGHNWLTIAPLAVGPLESGTSTGIDIQVTIPSTAALGTSDTATIILTSQNESSVSASVTIITNAAHTSLLPLLAR